MKLRYLIVFIVSFLFSCAVESQQKIASIVQGYNRVCAHFYDPSIWFEKVVGIPHDKYMEVANDYSYFTIMKWLCKPPQTAADFFSLFNAFATFYQNYNLPLDYSLQKTFPVIIFDTMRGIINHDLSKQAQQILIALQKNEDYTKLLQNFKTAVSTYDSNVAACVNQFVAGASRDQALQDYHEQRDPVIFTLYFYLLASLVATKQQPTQADVAVGEDYFQQGAGVWSVFAPQDWTRKISFTGFGTADVVLQYFFKNIASLHFSYAAHRLHDIQDLKTLDEFEAIWQGNFEILKDAQENFKRAADYYKKLFGIYKDENFNTSFTTYSTIAQRISDGMQAFMQGKYKEAEASLSGVPFMSGIIRIKEEQVAGDAAVVAAQKARDDLIKTQVPLLLNEKTTMNGSRASETIAFIDALQANLDIIVSQYRAAVMAYQASSDAANAAPIKSFFNTLITALSEALDIFSNISQAFTLVNDADKLLGLTQETTDVDSVDNSYSQAISLAKTADSKSGKASKNPDYVGIYAALGKDWSFETFFKQRAGLLFEQKASAIDPATYATDINKRAFVYDLYLKAYKYKEVLPQQDQQSIEQKLQQGDVLTQANNLKAAAQKTTDWTPQKNLDHYASTADNQWKSALAAYFAAYQINKNTGTLFPGADQAYQNALLEYAQAYQQNVPDEYFKMAGVAVIYYQAYLERLMTGDGATATAHEKTIANALALFFTQMSNYMSRINNAEFDVARNCYDQAVIWRTNFKYFYDQQKQAYDNQQALKPLPATTKKLLTQTTDATGLTVGSEFGTLSVKLGNLEQDFVAWCVKVGDDAKAKGQANLDSFVTNSKSDVYQPDAMLQAQVYFNTAAAAYMKAKTIYDQLKNVTQSNAMTANITPLGKLFFGTMNLNTVVPHLPATYLENTVYGLYFLKPAISTPLPPTPKDPTTSLKTLMNINLSDYVKTYTISSEDQSTLYRLATKYALSEEDWLLFTQSLNEAQFSLRYPLKPMSLPNVQTMLSKYPLTQGEQKEVADIVTRYAMPQDVQAKIAAYVFYLPTLYYLYSDLSFKGRKLASYNLDYSMVAGYLSALQGKPIDSVETLQKTLKLASLDQAKQIRDHLVDAYTYLNKMTTLTTTSIKGIMSDFFIHWDASGNLSLVENNKPTPALPVSDPGVDYLKWYPYPSKYYTLAQSSFGKDSPVTLAIDQLNYKVWLSSAYQNQLKLDYMEGVFLDDDHISALCYSNEHDYLVQGRNHLRTLKALIDNQDKDPQAVLAHTISDEEHATAKLLIFYYVQAATATEGADLSTEKRNATLAQFYEWSGNAQALFLVGDPGSPGFTNQAKRVADQFQIANGYYADPARAHQAMISLAAIFSRCGRLAGAKPLPMDTTKVVPSILANQQFVLHDWFTAAIFYSNAAHVLSTITEAADQYHADQIATLRSYYQIVVENMGAYNLLKNNQGTQFATLAQQYTAWYAQKTAVEREVVSISQDVIDMYTSINNLIIDSLIYLFSITSISSQGITPADDATKTAVADYLKQINLLTMITDEKTFNATSWKTVKDALTQAFDHFASEANVKADYTHVMQQINECANQLFSAITARYLVDWQHTDPANKQASDVLIAVLTARKNAMTTTNFLG